MRTAGALIGTLLALLLTSSGATAAASPRSTPDPTRAPGPTRTAALERVTGFGSNPGALSMFRYVPDGLPQGRPVVVVLHGCTQDAATYVTGAGWQRFADAYGFSLVAPQQETGNNLSKCFNWFQAGDRSRGQGEALSVRQMVDRTVADLGADASRVFVTGLSAGGAMTASLLAAYPDVFHGGAVIGGLPHGCASTVLAAYSCMNPGVTKTAAQWGGLVRSAYPAYTGPRPAVSVWHGTADATVVPRNAAESVKQWTDALGADQSADGTEALPGGTTRTDYTGPDGSVAVRSYLVQGMGHGTPVRPGEGCGVAGAHFLDAICSSRYIARDWGLTG
ncbi:extracellular catalytic domain type 1 short-chain-length polyhydroxyalkanoate depolymerase [Streptomyces daliensis]